MASVALAGCVSDDAVVADATQEEKQMITFTSPVVGGVTRGANVKGEMPDVYDKTETFGVFAVRHTGDFSNWASATLFMNNTEVKYDATLNAWVPEQDVFWPKDEAVTFAAYSPYGAKDDVTTLTYGGTGLSLSGFQVNATPTGQYDLMYGRRTYNKTVSDGGTSYSGVDLHFEHALSSIHFTAKTTDNSSAVTKLKKIRLWGVYSKGDFTEGIDETYTSYKNVEAWSNHSEPVAETSAYTPFNSAAGLTLNATAKKLHENGGSPMILLPQNLTTDSKLEITYTINSGGTDIEEVKVFDFHTSLNKMWQRGNRYTYNIIIGADKIYFSPEVGAWVDQNINIPGL